MFETAAPEIGEVVSGRKISKYLQKMWEQKQFGNNWEVRKKKYKRRTGRTRSISRKSRSKNSRSRKDNFDDIK